MRAGVERALASTIDVAEQILLRGAGAGELSLAIPVREAACAIVAAIQGYYVLAASARELLPRGSAAPALKRMVTGIVGAAP